MGPEYTQNEQPAAVCDRCGGEIYPEELVHLIDGFIICAECFEDYAYEYFESCMIAAEELTEKRYTYDDD
ncbi:MAG: hypothetical protein IJL71_01665 [Oscillospiraceae bacterium]|nr:hypothetical protein [Oscillospiraceae bacterium]